MREIPLDKIRPGPVRRNKSMRADIMQPSELATVPARLERIARRANEPLSESEIVEFEEAHRVVLPPDYRFYLRFIGNGWAGPDFGICRLGTWDDDRPWSGDDWVWLVGKLAEPFPHVAAWNPVPFDPDQNEPDDDLLTSIEPEYMASQHVNGSIPLSDMGCGIFTKLISCRSGIWARMGRSAG